MKLLFILFFTTSIYALNLQNIIDLALKNNPSLEVINKKISANKSNINLSSNFSNPNLSYTQNTLSSDQAMSRKTVSLKQKLPYFGKRDSLKGIAVGQEDILNESLELAKINLIKEIKKQVYTVWQINALLKNVNLYKNLTSQNIKLFESYTSTSSDKHMGIMSAELTLSDLHIQKIELESLLDEAYAKLSYFCATEISNIDISLKILNMPKKEDLQSYLLNNHDILFSQKKVDYQEKILKQKDLNKYPDVNLLASYSMRENFDNYSTFGLAINLPIYSNEKYKSQKQRELTLSAKSQKKDISNLVKSNFLKYYAKMFSSYKSYKILTDEALPQIHHMLEISNSSILTGADLFMYNDTLVKKLKLEQKSILATTNYFKYLADISALFGELK